MKTTLAWMWAVLAAGCGIRAVQIVWQQDKMLAAGTALAFAITVIDNFRSDMVER